MLLPSGVQDKQRRSGQTGQSQQHTQRRCIASLGNRGDGNRGLLEGFSLADDLCVGGLRIQRSLIVGIKAVISLAAVPIINSIGANGSLGSHQLDGIVQLHITEVGNGNIDIPAEVFSSVFCGSISQNVVIGSAAVPDFMLTEAIDVLTDLHSIQLFLANCNIKLRCFIDQIEVVVTLHIPHVVGDVGTGVYGVKNLILNIGEI